MAWVRELPKHENGEPSMTCGELTHALMQDIAKGLLDDHGPLINGERWGVGYVVLGPNGRPGFGLMRGVDIARRASFEGPRRAAGRIIVKREAALAFAERRRFPPPSWWQELPAAEPSAGLTSKSARRKNRGGHPGKWDWDAFYREIIRIANIPDGLPERPKLMKHMLDWCVREWGDEPALSGVRERVSKLYPE